ncbi:MAG: hypothetical protein AAB289_08910, partial [Chloroflexota bacterium]
MTGSPLESGPEGTPAGAMQSRQRASEQGMFQPVLSWPQDQPSYLPEPDEPLPGKLVVVEGIDGSGKSTQLDLLHKWLQSEGYMVVFSEWNSSPIVKGTTKRGKQLHMLSPMSFSLIHAADFASRIHAEILPALRA